MSIRLHPKHGVNPSLYQCFYCGGDIGLILAGVEAQKMFGDRCSDDGEAPRKAGALDKEPCDTCKGHMAQGIIIISVKDGEPDRENPYRTGGWWVVREEAIRKILAPGEHLDAILRKRVVFVEDAVCAMIGLPREPTGTA